MRINFREAQLAYELYACRILMRGVDYATRIHHVEIKSQAEAESAGAVIKAFANIFGLVEVVKQTSEVAKRVTSSIARCPKGGTLAAVSAKF
ncbi:MAG: hypothetical protein WAM09_03545 [Anaerolineales bacterium]